MKRNIILTFIILLTFTTFNNLIFAEATIQINSVPADANITVRDTSTQSEVSLGKTPFSIPVSEITSQYVKSSTFLLTIEKDGFEPYRVILAKNGLTDINLAIVLEISKDIKMIKTVDKLISGLFEVQRLVRITNYVDALKLIGELEKEFYQVSSLQEMKGGIYYLQKKYQEALSSYQKAFGSNPDNLEALKMKEYLEQKLKVAK